MKVSYRWLQTYFDDPLPPVGELDELLSLRAFEIEGVLEQGDDWLIDVDVLPNRSSDCLSHRGIARELSVLLDRPLKHDPLRDPLPAWHTPPHTIVRVDDSIRCPRYLGAIMRGVSVGPSPEWLQRALAAVGQRSINNVVDATNYVMLDLGQPLHAFDLAALSISPDGDRGIAVRAAHEHEPIVLLTEETCRLEPHMLVIADAVSDEPLAIAGVKGGKHAEVTAATTDIFLEAASFDYVTVRRTSRELKLTTEASVRFQNEPAVELPAFALRDVMTLITKIAGGVGDGAIDRYEPRGERAPISLTGASVNSLLGTALTHDDIERILVRFEWEFSRHSDTFVVTPPWERTDLALPEDIIEEVGRVHGYDAIAPLLPPAPAEQPAITMRYYATELVRSALVAAGFSEVSTYVLQSRGEVELENPLAADKAFLRASLTDGLSDALERNAHLAPLLGADCLALFEIGTVFRTGGEHLALGCATRATRGRAKDASALLSEATTRVAAALGVEPAWESADGMATCNLDLIVPLLPVPAVPPVAPPWHSTAEFRPWSVYPFATRDLALWAPEGTLAEEPLAVIIETAPDILVRHDQFDTFTKGGRTSYAWHLVFQVPDRTLTDLEVGGIMDAVTAALTARGFEVR